MLSLVQAQGHDYTAKNC